VYAAVTAAHPLALLPAAVLSSAAALSIWRSARAGSGAHRAPRLVLAVSVGWVAVSYWLDLFGADVTVAALLRRGFACVMYLALIWTAGSGKRYAHEARVAREQLSRITEGDCSRHAH
jgi:hypothetical protein